MRVDVLTIFPDMLTSPLEHSILGRAREAGLLDVRCVDLRDYTTDRHRQIDDSPYGGGPGMVMKPEPLFRAVEALAAEPPPPDRVILFTPLGRRFDQAAANELAREQRLVFLCGRYEGIDERVHRHLVTDELSIGDYVLTGGELAALVVIDAVARLLPGVLGKDESAESETFEEHLLEYPHYTRPADFRGWKVPDVLLSGHHGEVEKWRRLQSLQRTLEQRPDMFVQHELTPEDRKLLGLTPPKKKRKR
ncbi:MAG: tRNA (guanine-N1)-methyltransferase [Armatimonadetes bacterium]|jgi:tRNA (guanine37-N1)-methyltransferase|nr:tRNA (guanine-N1)-methyltransferase [Armatimonadota bacterium]